MKRINYTPFDYFIYRIPRFPVNRLFGFLSRIENDEKHLMEEMQSQEIREIIRTASPLLVEEMDKLCKGQISKPKDRKRIISSFVKYYSRMCTRCTPFGKFASCGAGTVNTSQPYELSPNGETVDKIRFDMFFLCQITEMLKHNREIVDMLTYYPNSTIYRIGNMLRYIETNYAESNYHYTLSTTEVGEVSDIIEFASNGAKFKDIVNHLESKGFGKEESTDYVLKLINSGVLVSNLLENVVGRPYYERLGDFLLSNSFVDNTINKIKDGYIFILRELENSNRLGITPSIDETSKMLKLAKGFCPDTEAQFFYQVDSFRKNDHLNLGGNIISTISDTLAITFLMMRPARNILIENFKKAFNAKYEEEEVPLLVALDPEIGIGYPTISHGDSAKTLIVDYLTKQYDQPKTKQMLSLDKHLLMKFIDHQRNGSKEIVFNESDLRSFRPYPIKLPSTLNVMFQVISEKNGNIVIYLLGLADRAGKIIARFAYGDSRIEETLHGIAQAEDSLCGYNTVNCEVVHMPSKRAGNILERPHFRKYEIPILTATDLEQGHVLPLTDLLISVRNNKILIRSEKMGKHVIPHLTTAHIHNNNSLPAYHFLGDVQTETEDHLLGFYWGDFKEFCVHLPRVRYKNIILSREAWKVTKDELNKLEGEGSLMARVYSWREKRAIPAVVLYGDGDNELCVYLNSEQSVISLLSLVKNKDSFWIYEFPFDFSHPAVTKGKDIYTNEIILPLRLKQQ